MCMSVRNIHSLFTFANYLCKRERILDLEYGKAFYVRIEVSYYAGSFTLYSSVDSVFIIIISSSSSRNSGTVLRFHCSLVVRFLCKPLDTYSFRWKRTLCITCTYISLSSSTQLSVEAFVCSATSLTMLLQ